MTIYFLSGLGADSRAFKHLAFQSDIKVIFIDWLVPFKDESLVGYAKRISEKIDTSTPCILVGWSFGGILATEVLEFVQPQKTIIISGVARRQELPFYYRLAGFLRLNRLIPPKATNSANALTYWMFGISRPQDKSLLRDILASTNTGFSLWAINEILHWKRTASPENLVRIHGNKDRVLPMIFFKPQYIVKGGGHFMVVNRAGEIAQIIGKEISTAIAPFS